MDILNNETSNESAKHGLFLIILMSHDNKQVVQIYESGMRNCPMCVTSMFLMHIRDSHIMSKSWQVYCAIKVTLDHLHS